MKNCSGLVRKYLTAETKEESLLYENQILVWVMLPLLSIMSVINLFLFPLHGISFTSTAFNSIFLFCVGLYMWGVTRLSVNINAQLVQIIIAFVLLLAFMFSNYYELIGLNVWLIYAGMILVAIFRNDSKLLIAMGIESIVLLIYVYFRYQAVTSGIEFISLSIIIVTLFIVAAVGKNVFIGRIEIIYDQMKQSKMVAQISEDLININMANKKDKVMKFLKIVGENYGFDRAGILLLSADKTSLKYEYQWHAADLDLVLEEAQEFVLADSPWLTEIVEKKETLFINDLPNNDVIRPEVKRKLLAAGIKSFMMMPIFVNDELYGFFTSHTVKEVKNWRDDQKSFLNVIPDFLSNIAAKLTTEKEMNYMAYYDTLTGLPNRSLLNKTVQMEIEKAYINGDRLAMLFIDLDSFKSVNDTLGHEKGDMLLQSVTERFHDELGPNHFAARFGGDEFVILMPHMEHLSQADTLAARMIQKLSRSIKMNQEEFFISASIGISVYPDDGDTSEALLKNADLAMNAAKISGKNQYKICTPEMKAEIEEKVSMINMLHKAQENRELELYYQPQVNINTGEIIGLEALLRWENDKFGGISPETFIPLAEKNGMIHSIGNWVLETACRQTKVWQLKGFPPVKIAVNVSIQQFKNADIAAIIFAVLDKTGLDPHYLEIEITESILIEEPEKVIPILSSLKRKGITISIDDFGTAYSSLARIKELPIDRIKIAMEFINHISVSKKDEELVKVILNLAERLGFSVIAEGVETKTQLNFLKSHDCEEVQGFYYYKPMPSKDIENIFRNS